MNEQVEEKKKPGLVQAIAIMNLVNGILNCLTAFAFFITIILSPLGVYPLIVGILELINSSRLLPDPIKIDRRPRYIAVLEIINILCLSVNSLIVGILCLIFYQDDKVIAYFESRKRVH